MVELLTPREAADRLGVSAKLLEAHRAELRGLPYIRLGRSIRYEVADIDGALALPDFKAFEDYRRRQVVADIRRRRRRRVRNRVKRGGK